MENPIACLQDFLPIALAFFDKDTSKERKNQFNEQLQELYKSQSAWKICKDILSHLDQYTTEVKFLAAKILRIKLYYYMIEVPEAEHEPMLMYIVSK